MTKTDVKKEEEGFYSFSFTQQQQMVEIISSLAFLNQTIFLKNPYFYSFIHLTNVGQPLPMIGSKDRGVNKTDLSQPF